jgi:16S rRNA (cytosine1402-N4)-methyltransferase
MHAPVLVAEVISHLAPARGGLFVDCTLGAGGHTRALLDAGATRVLGFDRDRTALRLAAETLQDRLDQVEMIHGDYRELAAALDARGIESVDGGVLADLGVSSMQLDDAERGFSFRADAPLDMRMDRDSGPTAAALLQTVDEAALADIIYEFGEERFSRRIARRIVEDRESAGPIQTTGRIAAIVRRAIPGKRGPIDRATRTFQALRIAVNRELEHLDSALSSIHEWLVPGGRIAIISFHSLEDRRVKHAFRGDARLDALTRKPITASEEERIRNPRARSAKMRVAERCKPTP